MEILKDSVEGYVNEMFIEMGLQYMHVTGNDNIWIGAETALRAAGRWLNDEDNRSRKPGTRSGYGNKVLSGCFVAEYNFFITDYFVPFVGAGVGTGLMYGRDYPSNHIGTMVVPRVGFHIGEHFRVTVSGTFISKYYNTVSIRLGWGF